MLDLLQPYDLGLFEDLHGIVGIVMTELCQVDTPECPRSYSERVRMSMKEEEWLLVPMPVMLRLQVSSPLPISIGHPNGLDSPWWQQPPIRFCLIMIRSQMTPP